MKLIVLACLVAVAAAAPAMDYLEEWETWKQVKNATFVLTKNFTSKKKK